MSVQPFNGWGSSISIQAESSFCGAGTGTVFSLAGQIRFTQIKNMPGKNVTKDFWRNETATRLNTSYFSGTIELEFGFNPLVVAILSGFFELVSTTVIYGGSMLTTEDGIVLTTESGLILTTENDIPISTEYVFIPARLLTPPSFKVGIGYSGSTFWTYAGLVIDSIQFVMQRNRIPSIVLTYKAAIQNQGASSSLLGPATAVAKNTTDHTQFSATFDTNPLPLLTEANATFTDTKKIGQYSSDGIASQAARDNFKAEFLLAEYFNPGSLFPPAVADQSDHAYLQQLLNANNANQLFQIIWPRVNVKDGMPDAIGAGDLVYRANMEGYQDTAIGTAQPTILIAI